MNERLKTNEIPSIEQAIEFIKSHWLKLAEANFITDEEYYAPSEDDIKVTWADFIYGGCYQIEEFSEQQGKTFQVLAYLVPKGRSFDIKSNV